MDAAAAEAMLKHWRAVKDSRNQVILDALAAGLSVNRIHVLSGVSRDTVYAVRDAEIARQAAATTDSEGETGAS